METNKKADNVISLSRKISDRHADGKAEDTTGRHTPHTRVIAITSGKGGVGKSNVVANVGFTLSRMGKQVLVLDADLGLGNLDILLGIAPKYNLSHVVKGEKRVAEILLEGPGGIRILPASSGIQELTRLTTEQRIRIFGELDQLIRPVDVLLIDTAAGISSNVMFFNVTAQEIIVVVTPEPTSITDAYALMKVLSMKYSERHFKLLVNMAGSSQEAKEVYRQLNLVTERFLDVSIEYFGHVLFDENVKKSVRIQRLVSDLYPESHAGRCLQSLGRKMYSTTNVHFPKGDTRLFWKHLLEYRFD